MKNIETTENYTISPKNKGEIEELLQRVRELVLTACQDRTIEGKISCYNGRLYRIEINRG